MDGVTEHTLYELHLSTGSKRCKYIGGGRYEFALEYQEFRPQKTMLMGVKNVKIPQFEKHLDLKLYVGHKHEKFSADKLKSFKLQFRTLEQLAESLEIIMNSEFLSPMCICLNFCNPHDRHVCDDSELWKGSKTRVRFKGNRFFLTISGDLRVVFSQNLVKTLGFLSRMNDLSSEEREGNYVMFEKPCYVSDVYLQFLTDDESRLVVVLYDSISDHAVLPNGESWPIFFSGVINGERVGKVDKLLTVKKMANKIVDKFCFGFFDGTMSAFAPEVDLKKYPLTFSIVFFEK